MEYIVKVYYWTKDNKANNEYFEFMELDDAKRFSDSEAEELRAKEENREINGFSVLIYEITNY